MHTKIRATRVTAILAFLLVFAACTNESESPDGPNRGTVTIYSSLPLRGDSRPQSEDIVRAMEMALEASEGKAGGYTIKYVSLDDASPEFGFWDPETVTANAMRAAGDSNTIAYLGEFNSGASAVSLPILNEAGILQVSPSNTYVGLTRSEGAEEGEPDKYYPTGERHYGRVVPADHVQAGAIVSYMRDQVCTKVFILKDHEVYGRGIADQVERNAQDQGLEVLGNDFIDIEAKNFKRPANDVKESSADCLFFGGITMNRAGEVTKAVAAAVPGIKMFFPDGCAETAFTEQFGADLAPQLFITNPTLDAASYPPAGQEFLDDFEAEFGNPPEPYAIYGYEAMSVVLDSIERAGEAAATTTEGRQAVIDAFYETTDRESVLGTYDIDPFGDTTLATYGAFAVEDGLLVFDSVIDVVVAEPITGPELTPSSGSTTASETPLEGTWRGGKVTLAKIKRERTDKEARHVLKNNGVKSYMVNTLKLRGDTWQAFVSADGGPEQPAQTGTFSVEGDLIHMVDDFNGAKYTYRFELRGDTLRIGLVESNAPPDPDGISDDAYQFAHYSAAPFVRTN